MKECREDRLRSLRVVLARHASDRARNSAPARSGAHRRREWCIGVIAPLRGVSSVIGPCCPSRLGFRLTMSDLVIALIGGAVGSVATAALAQFARARSAWAQIALHDLEAAAVVQGDELAGPGQQARSPSRCEVSPELDRIPPRSRVATTGETTCVACVHAPYEAAKRSASGSCRRHSSMRSAT